MTDSRIGVWLIGAKGGVATTAILGLAALKRGLIETTALVTELAEFRSLGLVAWNDLVVGGHEIRRVPLVDAAARLAEDIRVANRAWLTQCSDELCEIETRIRPGTIYNVGAKIAALADADLPSGESPLEIIQRLRGDIDAFRQAERLAHVVVVNVASTEPPMDGAALPTTALPTTALPTTALPTTWAQIERLLEGGWGSPAAAEKAGIEKAGGTGPSASCPLRASSLYAIAALEAGCSYVNFTPSPGATPAAIGELARLRGGCHVGCDGKTGETLLKSVLAPMFARRNLQVLSWVGHNIFGNMDGQVLDDPANKQAKVASKDHLIDAILGYKPQTHVSIEYIRSLGDWKTAWDHVHFAGFLGTPMTLQFIWQGCDSVLAAPLVLDLVRLTELARRRGQTGLLRFPASFFKSPLGVEEQGFESQFQMLQEWAREATEPPNHENV